MLHIIKLSLDVGLDGGGGGNRTRVRKSNHRNIYECSPNLFLAQQISSGQDSCCASPVRFPRYRRQGDRLPGKSEFMTPLALSPGHGIGGMRYLIKQRVRNYRWRL